MWLATNSLNCLQLLLIYARTTWPSVNFKLSICNSFLNKHATFTDKTVAVNSSLGIDINFFGETLDFLSNKLQWINPSLSTDLIQLHCPYPCSEASDKWRILVSVILRKLGGWRLLGICKFSTWFSFMSHFIHWLRTFPYLSSSLSVLFCCTFWL